MTTWSYPSKSSPGTVYTVTLADTGVIACDCRGWRMKKPGKPRECSHIVDAIATHNLVREVRGDYVFATTSTSAFSLHSAPEGSIMVIVGDGKSEVPDNQEVTMATTATTGAMTTTGVVVMGMKASAMVEGRFGHILDEDGYVIPAKFDAAFGTGEWVMDEKLDGHRIQIVKRDGDITTELRSIPVLPAHILASMAKLPDGIYDGELMVNMPGAVSTDVPNLQFRSMLIFAIFDLIELMGEPTTHLAQSERRSLLEQAVPGDDGVMLVAQYEPTWENVQHIWSLDGEGTILKKKNSPYRMGARTAEWIKVKGLEHHTATCTGFEAGSFGPTAIVLGRLDDGTAVRCKNRNNETLAETAADPAAFIGKRFVIQCQKRLRGSKHLRHPMIKEFEFDHLAGEAE